MAYQYINPESQGYQRFYIKRKVHNKAFPYYKTKWYNRYEYYRSIHEIRIDVYVNILGVFLETLCLPLNILMNGLSNYKEIIGNIRGLYSQKKQGHFHSYTIWSTCKGYDDILAIIEEGQ